MQRITLALGSLIVAATTLPAQDSAPPAGVTAAMIARGDSIYHGQLANGTCSACHGPEGTGVVGLTHDLTSPKRINGDGSFVSIRQIVRDGVPKPKQGVPMPPHGGAPLTPLDIHAVAAYVYSLSHPRR